MLTASPTASPAAWAGPPGARPGLGDRLTLGLPTAGADHHHVRVGQPQRLGGARLPLRSQAAHHPLPAPQERGQPPSAHQPLRQRRRQGQLQRLPRSRSALSTLLHLCSLPTCSSARRLLPRLLRLLGGRGQQGAPRGGWTGEGGVGELPSAGLPPLPPCLYEGPWRQDPTSGFLSLGSGSQFVPTVCNGREVVDSTTSSL